MSTISKHMETMRNDLISPAAELAEECCPQAMQDFAWRLRRLGNCHLTAEAMRLVPDLFLLADFIHVRYTTYEVIETGADGVYLLGKPNCAGELIQASLEPIELVDLVRTAQMMAESMYATSMGPGRWIESFALPIKDPGVFELALVVEPHEVNDGSEAARIQAGIRLAQRQFASRATDLITAMSQKEHDHEDRVE